MVPTLSWSSSMNILYPCEILSIESLNWHEVYLCPSINSKKNEWARYEHETLKSSYDSIQPIHHELPYPLPTQSPSHSFPTKWALTEHTEHDWTVRWSAAGRGIVAIVEWEKREKSPFSIQKTRIFNWAVQDLNLWLPACKAGALANWANRPKTF